MNQMLNNMKMYIFIVYYLIIIFLSINNLDVEKLQSMYNYFDEKDKFMHFLQYFFLVILALFCFEIDMNIKNFILVCIFTMLSSAMSEFIQIYLSSRDSSCFDWFFDVTGGIFGFIVFLGINRICCKK